MDMFRGLNRLRNAYLFATDDSGSEEGGVDEQIERSE